MIYSDFQDKKLSLLGFGTMRLPTTGEGSIDEVQAGFYGGIIFSKKTSGDGLPVPLSRAAGCDTPSRLNDLI